MYPTQIYGDLDVTHRLTTGGPLSVSGPTVIRGDLKVEGVLDAPNTVGCCKGVYRTMEELATAWPKPVNGWWAIVGGIPGTPMYAWQGLWVSGGGHVGAEVLQVHDYGDRLSALETTSSDASSRLVRVESMAENLSSRILTAESDNAVTRDRVAVITDDLLESRATDEPVVVIDHCAGLGSGTAQYNRSNFSGFANVAGVAQRAFDTLEVPVLAADWEGNTKPLSSVLVVIRRDGPRGEVLYSRTITFSPVSPGRKATLSLRLSDEPIFPSGTMWLEMHFDAPCTLYFCTGGQGDTDVPGRYYIGGRQSIDDEGLESVGHTTWWYIVYRLLRTGELHLGLNDRTVSDLRRRLGIDDLSAITPSAPGIPSVTESSPQLRLPSRLTAVRGDTLQLFYRGMIRDTDPMRWRPMMQGAVGRAFPRYWEITPDDATPDNVPLTLVCRSADGTVTASASTLLSVVSPPGSPATPLHVVCIGDSLTTAGIWPKEVRRRLCGTGGQPQGLGLDGIHFCGMKSDANTGWTGFSGWTWSDFLGEGRSAAGTVPATPNPLYDHTLGRISFKSFADTCCDGRIDVVYVLLGWNSLSPLGKDFSALLTSLRTFARRLHSDFPSARLRLMGLQMPSVTGGTGFSYGSEAGGYADAHGLTLQVHRLNETYAALAASEEFSSYVSYVEIAAQFDTDYSMPRQETPVNTRSSYTEHLGSNGVHPSESGYLQIADAVYRDLCALITQ